MGGFSKHNRVIYIIMVGAILFYLPFISKQFMGDDWLWLANAKMASVDPSIFLERPMYGYFRPLNMALIFIMLNLFGTNAWAFSLVNILLHACNIWLLWILLGRFNLSVSVRFLSALIFAFYALNASAIEWISVGHDLWVTGLSLLFAYITLQLIEKPAHSRFVLLWTVGFMAVLIKESGFVTIGIYFILLILRGKSPFRRRFLIYSLVFIMTYLLYLYAYFITRSVSYTELDLGVGTFINLWYFMSHLAAPISKRIAEGLPARYLWIFKLCKIAIVMIVPVALIFIFAKAKTGCRFFILWSVMFVSTIAIIRWDIHPFSLYPEKTAARFMYSAVPGLAVAVAWFITTYFNRRAFNNVYVKSAVIIFYIAANFLITHRISQLYFNQQALTASILEDFNTLEPILARSDTLVVLTGDMASTPQIIASGKHLHGIIYVTLDHEIKVIVEGRENYGTGDLLTDNGTLIIGWDIKKQRFMIPSIHRDLPLRNQIDITCTSEK